MTRHLAQFNIARIRYPLDDPRMREFADNVARVNGLADGIEGFVWRLADASGHAMDMRVYDDPRILPNLTVWENVEALERFVWKTVHSRFYGRRAEWFEHTETPLVFGKSRPDTGPPWRKASSVSNTSRRTAQAIIRLAGPMLPKPITGRRRAVALRHRTNTLQG